MVEENKYTLWYNNQRDDYYTSEEDRNKRIDKDHDEYIEGFRKVYEENPSYYESPEAFRKNMPLTKENFVWIKGGEDSWGKVSHITITNNAEVEEAIDAAFERMGGFNSMSDYGEVEYNNRGGKVFVWKGREKLKESKVGWIKRMARGILSKVNKRIK